MDEQQALRRAREALQRGECTAGQGFLYRAIQANPRSIPAWLWLSAIVGDPARERDCLVRVLRIDPQNETAQRRLSRLQPVEIALSPPSPRVLCPYCTQSITHSATVCRHCGHELDRHTTFPDAVPSRAQASPRFSMRALGLALTLACVALLLLVTWTRMRPPADDSVEAPASGLLPSLAEFEDSPFCRANGCRHRHNWDLGPGEVNHTFGIEANPDVLVEVSTQAGTPVRSALMFFAPSGPGPEELQLAYSFLSSIHPRATVDATVRGFVERNITTEQTHLCEADSIPFGTMRIWTGKSVGHTVSIREHCP